MSTVTAKETFLRFAKPLDNAISSIEEKNAIAEFGIGNYAEMTGIFFDGRYQKVFFSKSDTEIIESLFCHISHAMKLPGTGSSPREKVIREIKEKYKKILSAYDLVTNNLNRSVRTTMWNHQYEIYRTSLEHDLKDLMAKSDLADTYKKAVQAIVRYEVGYYVNDVDGD